MTRKRPSPSSGARDYVNRVLNEHVPSQNATGEEKAASKWRKSLLDSIRRGSAIVQRRVDGEYLTSYLGERWVHLVELKGG